MRKRVLSIIYSSIIVVAIFAAFCFLTGYGIYVTQSAIGRANTKSLFGNFFNPVGLGISILGCLPLLAFSIADLVCIIKDNDRHKMCASYLFLCALIPSVLIILFNAIGIFASTKYLFYVMLIFGVINILSVYNLIPLINGIKSNRKSLIISVLVISLDALALFVLASPLYYLVSLSGFTGQISSLPETLLGVLIPSILIRLIYVVVPFTFFFVLINTTFDLNIVGRILLLIGSILIMIFLISFVVLTILAWIGVFKALSTYLLVFIVFDIVIFLFGAILSPSIFLTFINKTNLFN